jgi:hypothetical protein
MSERPIGEVHPATHPVIELEDQGPEAVVTVAGVGTVKVKEF